MPWQSIQRALSPSNALDNTAEKIPKKSNRNRKEKRRRKETDRDTNRILESLRKIKLKKSAKRV